MWCTTCSLASGCHHCICCLRCLLSHCGTLLSILYYQIYDNSSVPLQGLCKAVLFQLLPFITGHCGKFRIWPGWRFISIYNHLDFMCWCDGDISFLKGVIESGRYSKGFRIIHIHLNELWSVDQVLQHTSIWFFQGIHSQQLSLENIVQPKPAALEFLRSLVVNKDPLSWFEPSLLDCLIANMFSCYSTIEKELIHTRLCMVDIL